MPRKPAQPPTETVTVPPGYRAELVRTGPGRPRTAPEGAKKSYLYLTDTELDAVRAFVARLRSAKTQ